MTIFLTCFGLATLAFVVWRFWFFLRNPPRFAPPGDSFLAPADGFVVYVKRVENGSVPIAIKQRKQIPLEELAAEESLRGAAGWLVGVYMTAFSVHHNRAPIDGTVVSVKRTNAARNRSMARISTHLLVGKQPYESDCEYLIENDRVTMIVNRGQGYYSLTQIADKWISHIINTCQPGQRLKRGERFGLIRFGSQVDVFLPDALGFRPTVAVGAYVYAGESVFAEKIEHF